MSLSLERVRSELRDYAVRMKPDEVVVCYLGDQTKPIPSSLVRVAVLQRGESARSYSRGSMLPCYLTVMPMTWAEGVSGFHKLWVRGGERFDLLETNMSRPTALHLQAGFVEAEGQKRLDVPANNTHRDLVRQVHAALQAVEVRSGFGFPAVYARTVSSLPVRSTVLGCLMQALQNNWWQVYPGRGGLRGNWAYDRGEVRLVNDRIEAVWDDGTETVYDPEAVGETIRLGIREMFGVDRKVELSFYLADRARVVRGQLLFGPRLPKVNSVRELREQVSREELETLFYWSVLATRINLGGGFTGLDARYVVTKEEPWIDLRGTRAQLLNVGALNLFNEIVDVDLRNFSLSSTQEQVSSPVRSAERVPKAGRMNVGYTGNTLGL